MSSPCLQGSLVMPSEPRNHGDLYRKTDVYPPGPVFIEDFGSFVTSANDPSVVSVQIYGEVGSHNHGGGDHVTVEAILDTVSTGDMHLTAIVRESSELAEDAVSGPHNPDQRVPLEGECTWPWMASEDDGIVELQTYKPSFTAEDCLPQNDDCADSGYQSTSPPHPPSTPSFSDAESYSDPDWLPGPAASSRSTAPPIPTSVMALSGACSSDEEAMETDFEDSNSDSDYYERDCGRGSVKRAKSRDMKRSLPQKRHRPSRRKCPQVWQFLLDVLCNPAHNPSIICWGDKSRGIFKIVKSKKVAQLWGQTRRPNNAKEISYEHFSRALRYYYSKDVIYSVPKKRLTYQFGPNAKGWKAQTKASQL